MIPLRRLFESHLTVARLERSMEFYEGVLGLERAYTPSDVRAAFYWIGGRGASMLGLWEVGPSPQRLSLRTAFEVDLADLLDAPQRLREAKVVPLDFWGKESDEPVVLAWMPAAAVYFHDPDGNLLEYLTMLPDVPQPELGVVGWNRWQAR